MITNKMKRVLIEELHYTRREVNGMSAEHATSIIANRISNRSPPNSYNIVPEQESTGMPQNNILEEMQDQFGDVSERVLHDDQYGPNIFSSGNDGCLGTWEQTDDGCIIR